MLPPVAAIEAPAMPEPFRALLAHESDMTSTLERFHGRAIHLCVLHREQDRLPSGESVYRREIVLKLNGSDQPVEYGAIEIHLDQFPEAARAEILAEQRPLGAILNGNGMRYVSRPAAFLRLASDPYINELLGLRGAQILFGRRNRLLNAVGALLADIVEILPPARTALFPIGRSGSGT